MRTKPIVLALALAAGAAAAVAQPAKPPAEPPVPAADAPAADAPPADPGQAELDRLDWMVGDWIDESGDSLVETSYRWTDNRRFLLGEFKVQVQGRPAMTGQQRIGWDPLAKKLRNWVFDSEGGFSEGVWTRRGDQWVAKMSGVTRDGKHATATNVLSRQSKDRAVWQARDRIVGDETLADTGDIPVVRKPPKPN